MSLWCLWFGILLGFICVLLSKIIWLIEEELDLCTTWKMRYDELWHHPECRKYKKIKTFEKEIDETIR